MESAGAVLLHGYGTRGYIWGPLQSALRDRLGPIATPDLEADSISNLLSRAKARIRRHSLECDAPVLVIGHSLGAVVAAIAARDLGTDVVSAVILMAPPYGDRRNPPGPVVKFLRRRRLIPGFIVRPLFFSSHTSRGVRRTVFRSVVAEKPEIQALTLESRWFHTGQFPAPLAQPALVFTSPGDRIVPLEQSVEFSRVLGARTHTMLYDPPVAHDDYFASATIVADVADTITEFVRSS